MLDIFSSLDKGATVLRDLELLFSEKPEALIFLRDYVTYCHLVDDMVDETKDIDRIRRCTTYATCLYSSDYWARNRQTLYAVDRITHNQYFDAVTWEHSEEEWKRRDARALNHCGYNMLFAVILLEFGEDAMNQWSIKYREYSHLKHKDDKI